MKTPRFWFRVFFSMSGLFLYGCGGDTGSISTYGLNGLQYVFLEQGTLAATPTEVVGTGKIIFRYPRPSEDSNYALSFSLKKNGSLSLLSNTDKKLNSGVRLVFGRSSSDALTVTLIDGEKSYDLSPDFEGLSASGTLNLSVDVHGHGHLIIFMDEKEFEYSFAVRPAGFFWGLELNDASVLSAGVDKPKKEH